MISDTNEIIEKVLIDEDSLNVRIKKLAGQINEHYKDEDTLIMVAILKGSVMFMAELAQHIKLDINLEFMAVSSYDSGTISSGKAKCAQIYMSPHRDTAMHTSNFATNQMGIYTSQQ